MNKSMLALGAMAILSLSAIEQIVSSKAVSDDWADRPALLVEAGAEDDCTAIIPDRHLPQGRSVAADQAYMGDFYQMIRTYGGIAAARGVLDVICASQAPGLILTVYRPGDGHRDGWCVARYGEATRAQQVGARSSAACRGLGESRS